jgi:hypothetical protein
MPGRRTTVTVPAALAARAERAAERSGRSVNATLIEFAVRGAGPFEAELDRRAEVEARARLVRSIGGSVGGPFPTDDEAAAARVLREE